MDRQTAFKKALNDITKLKRIHGYKYGISDCWNLFTTYDQYLRNESKLHKKILNYSTHVSFHAKIKRLGFNTTKEFILHGGYEQIAFEDAVFGDVCVFKSPEVDFTISIFNGEKWINSSNEPKYEALPSRFVAAREEYTLKPIGG